VTPVVETEGRAVDRLRGSTATAIADRDPAPLPIAPPPEVQQAQRERLLRTWRTPGSWRYWSSVNNSDVGVWYIAATFFFQRRCMMRCLEPGGVQVDCAP